MSTTITIKLNKPAQEFQAGEYLGFGIRGGVQYYDRETKKKEWTNYECALFSNNQKQIQFYRDSFIEGAVIEVSAPTQQIKSFDGQNGQILTIKLNDAVLGHVSQSVFVQGGQNPVSQQAPQQAPQRAPQQPAMNQQPNPANFQPQAPMQDGFDDGQIPF